MSDRSYRTESEYSRVSQHMVLHYRDSRLELAPGTTAVWVAELLRALA